MGCIAIVPQDRVYVIEQCGKFKQEAQPGFHCLGVPGICTVGAKANMRIIPLKVSVQTKTKDNVFVTILIAVQYAIKKDAVARAIYTLSDPIAQIQSYVYDAVRAQVPRMWLNDVFVEKDVIARAVQTELKEQVDQYGYEIVDTLIVDISPDKGVRDAMNDINASLRLKLATEHRAEAIKVEVVKEAEAQCESRFLQGDGIARQRKAIIEGLKNSVHELRKDTGVDSRSVMDLILVTQYFDTLKDITKGSGARAVFLHEDDGPMGLIQEEIRAGTLQGNIRID